MQFHQFEHRWRHQLSQYLLRLAQINLVALRFTMDDLETVVQLHSIQRAAEQRMAKKLSQTSKEKKKKKKKKDC